MFLMLVTLVPCILVGFGLGAGFGYKMGEQDEKDRIGRILKKRNRRYESR